MKFKHPTLVNLFLLPGLGYLPFKRWYLAITTLLICITTTTIITLDILSRGLKISQQIAAGVMPSSQQALIDSILHSEGLFSPVYIQVCAYTLMAFWLLSSLHVYRLSKTGR